MIFLLFGYFVALMLKFNNTDKDVIKNLTNTNDFTEYNDLRFNDYVMLPSFRFKFMENLNYEKRKAIEQEGLDIFENIEQNDQVSIEKLKSYVDIYFVGQSIKESKETRWFMPFDKCTRQEFEAKNYTFADEEDVEIFLDNRACPKNFEKMKMENSYSNTKKRKSVAVEVHLKMGDEELYKK